MARRIFVAADIDENIKDLIFRYSSGIFSVYKNARITPGDNLHITLKFIGNTPEEDIEGIKRVMGEAASLNRKFSYSLDSHLGAFPQKLRARIAYIGIAGGKHHFDDLYGTLEAGLFREGVKKENREFHPHITVARMRLPFDIEEAISMPLSFVKKPLLLGSITLYESILDTRGAKYIKIERFSLK